MKHLDKNLKIKNKIMKEIDWNFQDEEEMEVGKSIITVIDDDFNDPNKMFSYDYKYGNWGISMWSHQDWHNQIGTTTN